MAKQTKSYLPAEPAQPAIEHGSMAAYTTGFILSVGLTLAAYVFVVHHVFTGSALVVAILLLALVQFTVQLLFFLHLGQESKPRWKLTLLAFMLIVLGIVVLGSLWIMNNLNYNMTSHEANEHIIKDEGIAQ